MCCFAAASDRRSSNGVGLLAGWFGLQSPRVVQRCDGKWRDSKVWRGEGRYGDVWYDKTRWGELKWKFSRVTSVDTEEVQVASCNTVRGTALPAVMCAGFMKISEKCPVGSQCHNERQGRVIG